MASRISIPNLLTPDLAMQTVPAEVEFRSENASRPQTPPQQDTSLSTNDTRHQTDVEPCSDTTSQATAVHSLLSPAKLTSSGEPTLKDMFSVQMLQPSTITSSSLALQQQMFDGYGSLSPPDYSTQMLPPCCCNSFINFLFFKSLCDQQLLDTASLGNYDPAFPSPTCNYYCGWHPDYTSGVRKPLEDGASSGYFVERSLPETCFTGACLSTGVFIQDPPVELSQTWTHGFDVQPVPPQALVLGNGDNWDVAGEQNGLITVPEPFSAGQIASLGS
ncbi:hypothetical protein CI238_12909 [Colletotrichum incanum]|uniref:Uncharacterized protein n=1 Tax=Colletotrichum incanum TaxID=1573173 RepID=A0A161Y7V6_COLIC|nr:hypothetical protein CI238_12909 [Colletotrichum incanum]